MAAGRQQAYTLRSHRPAQVAQDRAQAGESLILVSVWPERSGQPLALDDPPVPKRQQGQQPEGLAGVQGRQGLPGHKHAHRAEQGQGQRCRIGQSCGASLGCGWSHERSLLVRVQDITAGRSGQILADLCRSSHRNRDFGVRERFSSRTGTLRKCRGAIIATRCRNGDGILETRRRAAHTSGKEHVHYD